MTSPLSSTVFQNRSWLIHHHHLQFNSRSQSHFEKKTITKRIPLSLLPCFLVFFRQAKSQRRPLVNKKVGVPSTSALRRVHLHDTSRRSGEQKQAVALRRVRLHDLRGH